MAVGFFCMKPHIYMKIIGKFDLVWMILEATCGHGAEPDYQHAFVPPLAYQLISVQTEYLL